jgi:gliding motility-associated-like protein
MKIRLVICFLLLLLSRQGYSQCVQNVTISQSAPAICSGNGVILTANTTGGTGPFSYAWNTGEITQSITINNPGSYTVTVTDKTSGCQPVKNSVTIATSNTPNAPTAKSVVICPNTSATLTATAPGGNYQWYDQAIGGNFLGSGATYTTPPLAATSTFYVETTINGCTSSRTPVIAILTGKPKVAGMTACSGSTATLFVSGGSSYTWYSTPSGGTVVGTGSSFTTPVLNKTTTYYVVAVINGCNSPITAVTATVTPPPQPPTVSNITICSGVSANLHANAPAGVINWYNVPVGGIPLISSPDYTTPSLTSTTTYYAETALNTCVSARIPVVVTVSSLSAAPPPQTDTVCYGTSATLKVAPPTAGVYQWYDAAFGGTLLATGNSYNTPLLNNSVTYYVQATNGACTSVRSSVNVIVKMPVPPPTVSGAIICPGSATILTATGTGGNYIWYSTPVGGTPLSSGAIYTTPILNSTTTYYVEANLGGCTSPRVPVLVTIKPGIPAPTASNASVCFGSSATLTAFGVVNSYEWYDSATGGNLLFTGQVYVTPDLTATTTYYVRVVSNGCVSLRTPVTVTVSPIPAAPIVPSPAAICPGTSATLTASGTSGTINWYNVQTGGTPLATGSTFITPSLTVNTIYYAENTSGPCISQRTPVTVSINPQFNPQFQYPSGTFCTSSPNPTPVINNPSGGTFSATPAGLVFVNTSTGQINIAASSPGNYLVSFTGSGVCSINSTAQVSIVTVTNANFSYSSSPYCQSGANPSPIFPAGATPGTFSASPAGLVFINTSTGQINLNASKPGTYTVTNAIAATGACAASTATSTIVIDPRVIVNAGPSQALQSGTPAQLAGNITGGTSSGTWSGGTGSFSNPSLKNAIYTPGPGETSAVLTLTSADPPGPCGIASNTVTITYMTPPASPTAMGITTCMGGNVILSATAPGGVYQWYNKATGGVPIAVGPNFSTPSLSSTTTYYVETTLSNITSGRTAVTVTVNSYPTAPISAGDTICFNSRATLTATGTTGNYEWYSAPVGGTLLYVGSSYTTSPLTVNTSYYVRSVVNSCSSPFTQVDVVVSPVPTVISPAIGNTCSGSPLNYTILANMPGTTFLWSRAQVAGISNPALINQTSPTINETLTNTTSANINVTYIITPFLGLCPGTTFSYTVTVYPMPIIISAPTDTVCNMTAANYAVKFNMPATTFSWSRAVVPGISNAAVSGQNASVIREVLSNTTNVPVDVPYVFTNNNITTCNAAPFNLVVTVNPEALVTSATTSKACSGVPQNYVITSNIPSATFVWSRNAAGNISNPAVTNQTSSTITEALINTGPFPATAIYIITPIAYGCPGTPFMDTVTVNTAIPIPVANNNSPVCVGTTLHLRTAPIVGATYLWTGPNGYQSASQNADVLNVTAANAGTYSLVVTVNGCSTLPVTTDAIINQPPVVDAGPDQTVCVSVPSVLLNGTSSTTTGVWTTSGTGSFKPFNNILNAQYIPSAADRAAGSVVLTLSSTSKDNCNIATDNTTIKFQLLPAVDAGPDQSVCSQDPSVQLAGSITIPGGTFWSSSGSGNFSPSANSLNATYLPSAADEQNGSVTLVLHAQNPGTCYIPTDTMTVKFMPPPTISAGGNRYILRGHTITLEPTSSDNNVTYLWSPNVDINDVTAKNPVITGDIDRTYTLTVTDSRGCVSTDTAFIKVQPEININNTFTPNGDGINDVWNITGLIAYVDATVDIFDRYGQKVFHSLGYPTPWDGTLNGKSLPFGVYYYVINTHLNGLVLSGYVTIIR